MMQPAVKYDPDSSGTIYAGSVPKEGPAREQLSGLDMQKKHYFATFEARRVDRTVRVPVVSISGITSMEINKHLSRRDIPVLSAVLQSFMQLQHSPADTFSQAAEQHEILTAFLELARNTRVTFRNREVSLAYTIDYLLGWDALLALKELAEEHFQVVKTEMLKRIKDNPDVLFRVRAFKSVVGKEAAEEAIRQIFDEQDAPAKVVKLESK